MSVVVIGRNEGTRLERCLESIRAADYPQDRIELIYADSDSTDDSCAAAERLGAKVLRLKPQRPAAAIGRNAGLAASRHELVHFFDGDTIVHPGWLARAAAAMADPGVACVFGRREETSPEASVYNFWMHHDWYVAPGPANSCAGDALFRRAALERAGGYDETLIAGEEPDLCHRIRTRQDMTILCLDAPMTRHDINMTRFGQYWKRCTRTGHAYAEVAARYPDMTHWRKARWRNLAHSAAPVVAAALSIAVWSPWPVVAWAALVMLALARNAWRVRARVGSLGGALLYSSHHYLSKLPATIGQVEFWMRRALHRTPKALIEYR